MPDSVALRLGAFAVGLIAAFGAAFAVGRAVGPVDDDQAPPGATTTTTHPVDHGEMGS